MNSISITFEHPHLLFLLIPAIAIIIIPFFLLPKVRRKNIRKILPVILHCIIAALVVLIAAGTRVVTTTSEEVTALLIDLSDSTDKVRDRILSDTSALQEAVGESSPVSIVVFADETVKAANLTELATLSDSPLFTADATNLAAAIEYTVSLLPKNKPKRIILLSDGRETDGDAAKTAEFYANLGVQIDSVFYDTSETENPEVQVNNVTCSGNIFLGDTVNFSLEVESNIDASVRIVVSDDGKAVIGQNFDIKAGTSVFEFSDTPKNAGVHSYSFKVLTTTDTSHENDIVYSAVEVTGASKVLIIADKYTNSLKLQNLLRSNGHAATVVSPDDAPKNLPELASYDEVILQNIDYNTLPENFGEMLNKYVADYGRSLLTLGGTNTYMLGNMEGTVLEDMLPVSFSLTEAETDRAVALMLVIDCSLSMSMNRSPNISMAKQGAIKCLEAMSEADYVSVITFSRTAAVRAPLTAANESNKQYLTRIISGLTTSSGTYYTEALKLAYKELLKSNAPVKHVMFLSDGQPNDRDYLDVIEEMAEDKITVSTIGLGYTSSQLLAMAEAGGGRYYYVSRADDLPDIMLSEAQQITIDSLRLGSFKALVNGRDVLTEGIVEEEIPTLSGYIAVKLKDEATAPLISDEGYPIFAKHEYGKGIVATFTSDLAGYWSTHWLATDVGNELMERLVSTTLPKEHVESSLEVSYELYGKTAKITVHRDNLPEGQKLFVSSANGDAAEYPLTKAFRGDYEATVNVCPRQVNTFTVFIRDENGNMLDFNNVYIPVGYTLEYREFSSSGLSILNAVCGPSGGTVKTAGEGSLLSLIPPTGRTLEYITDLLIPFAVAALILLLLDITIRKLRWKDIARFFRK